MFTSVLEGGDEYIRTQCPSRYSFLVVRNGKLVFERYYHGATKDSALHVMSMSKSVLSILIGQALEEKSIDTLDHKMLDYYPEYTTPSMDPRKRDITLRHLLTMTAGFQWDEVATSPQWVASPDWFRFAINLPLAATPAPSSTTTPPSAICWPEFWPNPRTPARSISECATSSAPRHHRLPLGDR